MAETNRQWVLASRPSGTPTMENFELVEDEVPEPGTDEVVVRTLYMSVDPYMRGRMRDAESYAEPWAVGDVMKARCVGEVVASKHHGFEPGDVVTGNLRWAEYAVAPGHTLTAVDPDLAPISTYLGVLGMPGQTAYFGVYDIIDPTPGDTVFVSGAAGAVGSTACQLAKLAGCTVVGTAGSDTKVDYLTEDLGVDRAINYKTANVSEAVPQATPDGVDGYFDNVGGEVTDVVFRQLNTWASVGICGQIAHYNAESVPTGPRKLPGLITTRSSVEGFLVSDFADRFGEASRRLGAWVASGDLQYRETVTEGIDGAPDAFLGLFEGENIGKQLVEVAERDA